ncbi:MAG: hypothetical protein COS99_00230 [Candidatus Omnitrophica bacterium CG07_land_8_20_14_0_80_42_15]|uniref:Translocation and assembly module TamB C-terminal domain-containing protein n=1 Tax=Candidatus Aquitaenariimonas noxiae TaxID=1974741 RepID=A0A2J0KYQ1_9BACT|nr:MAG: hypothetical protein COS99_00230 [Candidatus Omnitrophica bacterium CG07_land_8_20_14_0_80_42_15]
MRFKTKFILSAVIIFVTCLAVIKSLDFLKEKYFYRFITNQLTKYSEKKWNADIYIGKIKGNIFTNLTLKDVALKDFKNYPKDFQFKSDSVQLRYRPLGIFFGRFDADLKGCRIIYGKVILPLDINHHNQVTTIVFGKKSMKLEDLTGLLPHEIRMTGLADFDGEIVLKDVTPHLLNINIKSRNCQLSYDSSVKINGSVNLEISGKASSPLIFGDIELKELYITGGFFDVSSFKDQKASAKLGFLKDSIINIDVRGDDIAAKQSSITARLDSRIKIKKDRDTKPYISGKVDIKNGSYQAYDNRFRITGGYILFRDLKKSPLIELEGDTRIRRYKIYARIKGTVDDSHLTLSSKPELSYPEIVSLFIFGKNFKNLTDEEREKLTDTDVNNILINDLFLGKAEARLARSVGLDDINMKFDTSPDKAQKINLPAVEFGKYIANDKLYVTYSTKPKEAKDVYPEQSVGGEVEITDNITLKGQRTWKESLNLPQEDRVDVEFRWNF